MAHRVARGRSARRKTLWLDFAQVFTDRTNLAAATAVLASSLNAAALALRPFTVVRSYLECMVRSDQAAAVENQGGAIGMCVVSDQANTVGVTAVPTPSAEAGSDLWYLHRWFHANESSVATFAKDAGFFSVDSKAMRKVEEGSDLILVAELNSTLGSGLILSCAGRILVKLH